MCPWVSVKPGDFKIPAVSIGIACENWAGIEGSNGIGSEPVGSLGGRSAVPETGLKGSESL